MGVGSVVGGRVVGDRGWREGVVVNGLDMDRVD